MPSFMQDYDIGQTELTVKLAVLNVNINPGVTKLLCIYIYNWRVTTILVFFYGGEFLYTL